MDRPILRRLFRKKEFTEPSSAGRRKQERAIPRKGTTVLIVDDSTTVRFVMSRMLPPRESFVSSKGRLAKGLNIKTVKLRELLINSMMAETLSLRREMQGGLCN